MRNNDLVVESTYQCHAPLDPVVLRFTGGNFHRDNIVSGMASGGESTYGGRGRRGERDGGMEK